MTDILLSIDPGKTGALAAFEGGKLRAVHDPVNGSLTKRFSDILLDCLDWRHAVTVVIEKVNGVPGQSGPASFNFGKSFGELLGVCVGLGVEPVLVPAVTWKAILGLKRLHGMSTAEHKRLSIEAAAKRWGTELFHLAKHDGRAEAALLGAFWLEHRA